LSGNISKDLEEMCLLRTNGALETADSKPGGEEEQRGVVMG